MNTQPAPPSLSLPNLARAPHRLMFFIGAFNVLALMGWWTLWLVAQRWGWPQLPQPPIPAGWAHALMMPLQVLAPFMFGFLLTVFPRWTNQPELSRWHYVPVGLGLLGGQLLMLVGLWGYPHLVHLGTVFSIAGWSASMAALFGVLWREQGRTWHALSCFAALSMGLCAWLLFAAWLHAQGELRWVFAAIKIAVFGFALPIYVTVCHRMLPFFAGAVIPGYRPWRPMHKDVRAQDAQERPLSWLATFWLLVFAHLLLELMHGYAWLWLADLPMLVLSALALYRWWPRHTDAQAQPGAPMPGLLAVLLLGFAWLPIAFGLFAAQSLIFSSTGAFVLGRAPVHALTIGFFGSLLVAMVTRVTQGHSGQPLQMTTVAWFAFVCVQAVALLRVLAEVLPDAALWQALAAIGWLLAFTPWVLRSARIYLSPRVDGRPG